MCPEGITRVCGHVKCTYCEPKLEVNTQKGFKGFEQIFLYLGTQLILGFQTINKCRIQRQPNKAQNHEAVMEFETFFQRENFVHEKN